MQMRCSLKGRGWPEGVGWGGGRCERNWPFLRPAAGTCARYFFPKKNKNNLPGFMEHSDDENRHVLHVFQTNGPCVGPVLWPIIMEPRALVALDRRLFQLSAATLLKTFRITHTFSLLFFVFFWKIIFPVRQKARKTSCSRTELPPFWQPCVPWASIEVSSVPVYYGGAESQQKTQLIFLLKKIWNNPPVPEKGRITTEYFFFAPPGTLNGQDDQNRVTAFLLGLENSIKTGRLEHTKTVPWASYSFLEPFSSGFQDRAVPRRRFSAVAPGQTCQCSR